MDKPLAVSFLFLMMLICRAENYPPTFRAVKLPEVADTLTFTTQVAADSFGNTFWAGGYYGEMLSIGSLNLTNDTQEADFFLFKLGTNLGGAWVKGGGGGGDQGVTGMALDPAGNVYFAITAWRGGLTFDGITNSSPSNALTGVFKYSQTGERIWAHTIDGIIADGYSKTLALDDDGNVIVAGVFEDNRTHLRKLDGNGIPIWSRTGPAVRWDFSLAVQADPGGNILLITSFTNATLSIGSESITNNGIMNYALVKYSASGDVVWARGGGGSNSSGDYGIDVAVDEDGSSYVLSPTRSPSARFGELFFTLNSHAWFVIKYNPSGQVQWAKFFPLPYLDTPIGGLSIAPNGNVLVSTTGRQAYYGGSLSGAFLAECTPSGEVLWTKRVQVQPPIEEEGEFIEPGRLMWSSRMVPDDEGNFYVAGRQEGSFLKLDSFSILSSTPTFFAKLTFDPLLSSAMMGNFLTLSWPTNEPGFALESSVVLDQPIVWEPVTNSVIVTNGQNVVSGLSAQGSRFYRLQKIAP